MSFSFATGSASRKATIGVLPKHQRPSWAADDWSTTQRSEIGLQLVDGPIDLLAERDPIGLIPDSAMDALANSIIWYDDLGALVSAASSGKRVMVAHLGHGGVGSTKVRAGRRQTLG
jgi:hypothetical protein